MAKKVQGLNPAADHRDINSARYSAKKVSKKVIAAYARAAEIINDELGCDELRVRARGDTLDISTEYFDIIGFGLGDPATAREIADAAIDEILETATR